VSDEQPAKPPTKRPRRPRPRGGQRAIRYWEEHLPHTVKLLKAQGPQAFPLAIRKAAYDRM
jgi:hypothetical protein